MAKDQRNVEAITPMEEDFAKWYTDICLKAELVDYASVKGFMILRPYGYAIWENIQKHLVMMYTQEFKKMLLLHLQKKQQILILRTH